jgi:hypothetical protein
VGVETVADAFSSIFQPLINIATSGNLSKIAAVAGISILLIMAAVYAIYGLVKVGKLLWNLRIRSLALGLTVIGVVLICLAIVLPY